MLNFKKTSPVAKPKSKTREWFEAIGYAVLFSPRVRVNPKFKAKDNTSASPIIPEE